MLFIPVNCLTILTAAHNTVQRMTERFQCHRDPYYGYAERWYMRNGMVHLKGCGWKRFYHVKVSPRHSTLNHLSSRCCKTAMVECKLRNKLLWLTALTALRAIYLDSGAGTNLYGTLLNACFLSFCSLSSALVTMKVYKYVLKKWFNIGGYYQTIFYFLFYFSYSSSGEH